MSLSSGVKGQTGRALASWRTLGSRVVNMNSLQQGKQTTPSQVPPQPLPPTHKFLSELFVPPICLLIRHYPMVYYHFLYACGHHFLYACGRLSSQSWKYGL